MKKVIPFFLLAVLSAASLPQAGAGQGVQQSASQTEEPLRVFLDCDSYICDFDHFRREVDFVSYVRDRMDAELHVLVASQSTGAGGQEYTFFFIGLGKLEGTRDTLRYTSLPDETDNVTRSGLVRTFKLGLVRYLAPTSIGRRLDITYSGPGDEASAGPIEDPWDLWVFRVSVGGEFDATSREKSKSIDGSISAGRITEDLKLDFRAEGDWNQRSVELDKEGEKSTFSQQSFEGTATGVWSMSPHWSAGGTASASGSTRQNQDLTLRAGPALEYNIFPYSESTQRQITFLYKVEVASFNYEEVTLFDKTEETRVAQSLGIASAFQRPWGELDLSLEGSNFLDDFKQHRIEFFSRMEIRLFRGLSLDIEGSAARVKDQIYEPKEDIPL
ncbi:MAG: hypothetical protein ABIF09_02270, partial [Gemmatimonadota bacterium]